MSDKVRPFHFDHLPNQLKVTDQNNIFLFHKNVQVVVSNGLDFFFRVTTCMRKGISYSVCMCVQLY